MVLGGLWIRPAHIAGSEGHRVDNNIVKIVGGCCGEAVVLWVD